MDGPSIEDDDAHLGRFEPAPWLQSLDQAFVVHAETVLGDLARHGDDPFGA
jgi:hypothetical protein